MYVCLAMCYWSWPGWTGIFVYENSFTTLGTQGLPEVGAAGKPQSSDHHSHESSGRLTGSVSKMPEFIPQLCQEAERRPCCRCD